MNATKLLPILLFSAAANATPITLASSWEMHYGSGNSTMADVLFTYEDATPDSNANTCLGLYNNPLLAMTVSYADTIWSLNSQESTQMNTAADGCGVTSIGIAAHVISNFGVFTTLNLGIEGYPFVKTPGLALLADQLNFRVVESHVFIGDSLAHSDKGFMIGPVTKVPEPTSLSLLAIGLFGLVVSARRKSLH